MAELMQEASETFLADAGFALEQHCHIPHGDLLDAAAGGEETGIGADQVGYRQGLIQHRVHERGIDVVG
ncbi:hypothetical protein D3C78_1484030 [compost metagenome]